MKPSLKDEQIAALVKAALDNNAAIVQYCALIYGNSRDVRESVRQKWHRSLLKQWQSYSKQVEEILEVSNE